MLAGFVSIYFTWASALLNGQQPFPLIPSSHAAAALGAIAIGGILFLSARASSDEEPKFLCGVNLFVRLCFLFLTGVGLIFAANQPSLANLHSIDLLIYEGRIHHETWLSQASGSKNLKQAVMEYRKRYNQYPPP